MLDYARRMFRIVPFFDGRREKRFIGLSDLMRLHDKMFLISVGTTAIDTIDAYGSVHTDHRSSGKKSDNRVVYHWPLISPSSRIHSADALDAIFSRHKHARTHARTCRIALRIFHDYVCILTVCELKLTLQSFRKVCFNKTDVDAVK